MAMHCSYSFPVMEQIQKPILRTLRHSLIRPTGFAGVWHGHLPPQRPCFIAMLHHSPPRQEHLPQSLHQQQNSPLMLVLMGQAIPKIMLMRAEMMIGCGIVFVLQAKCSPTVIVYFLVWILI